MSERIREDSEEFNTEEEELEIRIDEWTGRRAKTRGLRLNRLARVKEELAQLEKKKEVYSAALAWLIEERENATDAKVWACAKLERTIPAMTRERQKLEDDVWQATDKYNEAVRRAWEDSLVPFGFKSAVWPGRRNSTIK